MVSSGFAPSIAACIESPGFTLMSAADAVVEIIEKKMKVNSRGWTTHFFSIIKPSE